MFRHPNVSLAETLAFTHTERITQTHATCFTHTRRHRPHARPVAVSHSPTHTLHTRAHTRANSDTDLTDANARTNERSHSWARAHVRAPTRPSARPCLRQSVRLVCRATLLAPRSAVLSWSVLACHDVLRPCVSQDGATALHDAAYNGHAPCIEVLLRAGADISTQRKVSAVSTSRANSDRRDVVVVFRCVVPSPKRFSRRNARIHTHRAHHTDTRNMLHTHTQTQTPRTPCRSFSLPHPHLTHTCAHPRELRHRPHRCQRTN